MSNSSSPHEGNFLSILHFRQLNSLAKLLTHNITSVIIEKDAFDSKVFFSLTLQIFTMKSLLGRGNTNIFSIKSEARV